MNRKVGEAVEVVRGGKNPTTAQAKVVEVVPPEQYPKDPKNPGYKGFNRGKQAAKRDHESYVVETTSFERLWPRVSALKSAAAPELHTDWVILLDSSGSMRGLHAEAVRAFNDEVEAIKVSAANAGIMEPRVSLWFFGENSGDVRLVYHRRPVSELMPLGVNDYRPSGYTPLFGCVSQMTERMLADKDVRENENLSVVVHVITDGNATDTHSVHLMQRALAETRVSGRWTHALMVPKGRYKADFLSRFPGLVPESNILEWDTTVAGVAEASKTVRESVNSYTRSRSAGAKSVTDFFQPDLSKLTAADLAKMDDLSKHFKTYEVKHEASIKDFIEGVTKKPYVIGSTYYQLMKTEREVQKEKGILLRDRATKKIFGGLQARRLIGLPHDKTVKVEPGNHANFDIFIESTSPNRKLPSGTKVLHDFNQKIDKQPTWDFTQFQSA